MTGDPALDWARSGLMGLTGAADGPPLVPAFDAAAAIHHFFDAFATAAGRSTSSLGLDYHLLTERARLMQLARGGQQSCNRSCRLLEARDGWLALNLPRPHDFEMLQPWIGVDADGCGDARDIWAAIAAVVARHDRAELLQGAAGLSLAVAAVPDAPRTARPAVAGSSRDAMPHRDGSGPLVIDLSSIWAGPLCGRLLALAGARVIKVESRARPETMRQAWPKMFDRLNAGKESVALDFDRTGDHALLRALLARADIVIGSARPRAFTQLGIEPGDFLVRNPRLAWVAITAHGWHGEGGDRVGFGDDAAAAAGLVATEASGRPTFVGDAIADPLTGIAAATAALEAWRRGKGGLYDVSLRATAAQVAASRRLSPDERGELTRRDGAWWLRVGSRRRRVAAPGWRRCAGRAARFGADTRRVAQEFN